MKRIIRTYFSEDIVSAIIALIIFISVAVMIGLHISIGVRGTGLIFEFMLALASCGLVIAVYKENKKEAKCHGE